MTTNAEHYFAPRAASTVQQQPVTLEHHDDGSGILVASLAGLVMGMALTGIILGSVLA